MPSHQTSAQTAVAHADASRRVVVAMSGGVDSSVVAALLKRDGHDVVGVTLQLYDHGAATGRRGACCAGQDIHDARRVADRIGIPHYVLDYEARFRAGVMQAFADSYAAGETPIPCVTCNQRIKFHDLLDTALELGAGKLATGHYIERRDGAGGPELYRAHDADRDQSYFLFATTRAQLNRLMFPLGGMAKSEVRRLARELALPVAEKPDSQDICFVPQGRYSELVEKLRPGAAEPGDIVHVDGRVLGSHTGTARFTVGQRRGLAVADGERLYVVGIEPERRRVVVGPRMSAGCAVIELAGVNWLAEHASAGAVEIKHRYNEPAVPGRLELLADGRARVELLTPQPGVAPGQACVCYRGTRLLGGGWIERAPALWETDAFRRTA